MKAKDILRELERDKNAAMLNFNAAMGEFDIKPDVCVKLRKSFSEGLRRVRRYTVAALIYDLSLMSPAQRESYLASAVESGSLGRGEDEEEAWPHPPY